MINVDGGGGGLFLVGRFLRSWYLIWDLKNIKGEEKDKVEVLGGKNFGIRGIERRRLVGVNNGGRRVIWIRD